MMMIRLKSLLPMQYQQVVLFYFIFVPEQNILSPRHRHENESVKMNFHRLGEIIILAFVDCMRHPSQEIQDKGIQVKRAKCLGLFVHKKHRRYAFIHLIYKLFRLGVCGLWISALRSIWIRVWSAPVDVLWRIFESWTDFSNGMDVDSFLLLKAKASLCCK